MVLPLFLNKVLLAICIVVCVLSIYAFIYTAPVQEDSMFIIESSKYEYVEWKSYHSPVLQVNKKYKLIDFTSRTIRNQQNEKLIFFFIHGHMGNGAQIIPYLNCLRNETIRLSDYLEDKHEKIYDIVMYAFDFDEEPSAFSDQMVEEQVEFVQEAIFTVMNDRHRGQNFTIISHNMGTVVGLTAVQNRGFIKNQIHNFISLNGPVVTHPVRLHDSPSNFYEKIQKGMKKAGEDFFFIQLHGGAMDWLFPPSIADPTEAFNTSKDFYFYPTKALKNVFVNTDYINILFRKKFLDAFTPFSLLFFTSDTVQEKRDLIHEYLDTRILEETSLDEWKDPGRKDLLLIKKHKDVIHKEKLKFIKNTDKLKSIVIDYSDIAGKGFVMIKGYSTMNYIDVYVEMKEGAPFLKLKDINRYILQRPYYTFIINFPEDMGRKVKAVYVINNMNKKDLYQFENFYASNKLDEKYFTEEPRQRFALAQKSPILPSTILNMGIMDLINGK